MANGLPSKAKVGILGKTVEIDPSTYFLARRMERAGLLRPGQALQLSATLPSGTREQTKSPRKGKTK